jgi:hypothetical protein
VNSHKTEQVSPALFLFNDVPLNLFRTKYDLI